jgi:peroxiredoxin
MALQLKDTAPAFELPEGPGQMVDVGKEFASGPVVLLFFPLAFSSVCTEEFCTIRDDWSSWTDLDAKVYGISVDSPFVVKKFKDDSNLPFPLLSDFNKVVSTEYGALHEDFMGLKGISKRAAFVVDRTGEIAYAWVSEDPGNMIEFEAIKAAVSACRASAH